METAKKILIYAVVFTGGAVTGWFGNKFLTKSGESQPDEEEKADE